MNKLLLTVSCLLFQLLSLHAQDTTVFKAGTHKYEEGELKYRVLYPKGYQKSRQLPLLIFLHGAGERGGDNKKQLTHGSKLFVDNREKYPAIVIFPQCPKDDYWANVEAERDTEGNRHFNFKTGKKPTLAMSGVISLVDSLLGLSIINPEQVYVGGLSMGGMGTFEIVSRMPKTFAAAFAICGGGNPKSAKKYARRVPFWIFHGAKDDVVPPGHSKEMAEAIKKYGGQAKLTIYPEANHNSWDSAFAEPQLLPWLFSNTKE